MSNSPTGFQQDFEQHSFPLSPPGLDGSPHSSLASSTTSSPAISLKKERIDSSSSTSESCIKQILHDKLHRTEDAFYAADMGSVIRQYQRFKRELPRVEPFYAIKCNPDPVVIKTLLALGTGFDCASKGEIEQVLQLGATPSEVIYANPCKQISHIRAAREAGVHLMTFDNAQELQKVKQANPDAKMVLRIKTDDSHSVCAFSTKFGAHAHTTKGLLRSAKDLGLDVVGVSFHVGSGCKSALSFVDAVKSARRVFDEAAEFGFQMNLLDLGGGYPGANSEHGISFEEITAVLRPAVDEYFPAHVRVIAEPGRYFVSAAYTLAVAVTSRRVIENPRASPVSALNRSQADGDASSLCASDNLSSDGVSTDSDTADDASNKSFMYYINDGVYGSFNCLLFDHAVVQPRLLTHRGQTVECDISLRKQKASYPCSLWGPTCDSMDCITKDAVLPELHVGDWLYFENMGAYTVAAASRFNGFDLSSIHYVNTEM